MLGNLQKRKALLVIEDHGIVEYSQFFVVFERLLAMKVRAREFLQSGALYNIWSRLCCAFGFVVPDVDFYSVQTAHTSSISILPLFGLRVGFLDVHLLSDEN